MKSTLLIILLSLATSQVDPYPQFVDPWSYCGITPQPLCLLSDPVCGSMIGGLPRTYSNACDACQTTGVFAYRKGSCPDFRVFCPKQPPPPPSPKGRIFVHFRPDNDTWCFPFKFSQVCGFHPRNNFREMTNTSCCQFEPDRFYYSGLCPGTMHVSRSCGRKGLDRKDCGRVKEAVVCGVRDDAELVEYRNSCEACVRPMLLQFYLEMRCIIDTTPVPKE